MDQTLVSIIVPVFNARDFLFETIKSVQVQTYNNWELILVDDGSTDDSAKVISSFDNPRIIYHYQNNNGQASARNYGVKKAKGDFIAFLDSDDLWEPEKLKKQIAILEKHPYVDIVFTNTKIINSNGQKKNVLRVKGGYIQSTEMFSRLYEASEITNSSVMLRRSSFSKVGPFNESPIMRGTEDYDMWLRLASCGSNFFFLDEPLTVYRIHPNSTSQNRLRMINGGLSIFNQYDLTDNISPSLRIRKYRDYYREKITLEVQNKMPKKDILAIINELHYYDKFGVITYAQTKLFKFLHPRMALFISQVLLYRILAKFVQ